MRLIGFLTLAAYEQYRKALADDPLHKQNTAELERSGAIINMERSVIERHGEEKFQLTRHQSGLSNEHRNENSLRFALLRKSGQFSFCLDKPLR